MQSFTTPEGDEANAQAVGSVAPESPADLAASAQPDASLGGEAVLLGDPALPGEGAHIVPVSEATAEAQTTGQHRRIVSAAALIMLGQLLSSVLGMVRIEAINILFYGAASGAFIIALRPIQQLSDLLVGGSVSGALIPTFVDYSAPEKRQELRRVYSTVATLVTILMALAVVALFFLAPWLATLYLKSSSSVADHQLTASFIRITAFGLFGLGLYAVGSALLYALKDVVYPAFATFIQHVGVIAIGVITLFLAGARLGLPVGVIFAHQSGGALDALQTTGAVGLAAGFVIGAAGEAALILPGLRRSRTTWRPAFSITHPAVRQIARLYIPIAAGLLLSLAQQNAELILNRLAPGDTFRNITALQSATTLVQFPTGLVAAALSFAVLPPLTAAANAGDTAGFKRTLALGFRLGLLLMTPAMVGLIALRTPVVALLFQHGACHTGCTYMNALALQNYAYQLPFLALDQLLIAAFYARKNTIVPVVVGVVAIGLWAAVAVPFAPIIGMPALAFANATLNSGHAIILFVLLTIFIGNLGLREFWAGLWRIALASAVMGGVIWGLLTFLPQWQPTLFTLDSLRGQALTVVGAGVPAALIYFALVSLLGVQEIRMLGGIIRMRLGGGRA
ncbi:MAG TPA: lipid II flippase MurJ [Ktedonobacterales bacterium]|nr:lipid II flippase MurJ [Ktedonobacterales bacterium]